MVRRSRRPGPVPLVLTARRTSQQPSAQPAEQTKVLAVEITTDLPNELMPVAWLIGTWAGAGVGGYPGEAEFRFGQEITFSHDGRPFLSYWSRSWLLDEDGNPLRPLATESGYWRPQVNGQLEVLLSHPTGINEIYVGEAQGGKVELRTDVVARTVSSRIYTAATRLYGLVEGDLLWAYDMAADGQPLQSHVSARLKRIA
jgi:hypothetical protein